MKKTALPKDSIKSALDGRTLTWLAARTGIDIGRLSRLNAGRQPPYFFEIARIAAATAKDISEFARPAAA